MMTEKEIKTILKQDYNYVQTLYSQDRILGVFVFGKASCGLAESIKDIQVKAYYLPSLEDMCIRPELIDEGIEYNNHTIYIKDIRLILDNILNQESTTMECFFSKNYIITPKFKKVFVDNIIEKREDIFHCNPEKFLQHTIEKAYDYLTEYYDTGFKDRESLFNACKRRIVIDLYLQGASVEDCINLKKDYHINYLLGIKNGTINPTIEDIRDELQELMKNAPVLENHPEQEEMVKSTILEIMKIALTKTVSTKEFLHTLTDIEKEALKIIMQYLEFGEGVVSISQLVEQHSISRPVFKSILQKMKDMDIAEINNQGMKGTYIKIIDGGFLAIDEHID